MAAREEARFERLKMSNVRLTCHLILASYTRNYQSCSTRTRDSDSSPTRVPFFGDLDSDSNSRVGDSDLDSDLEVQDSDLDSDSPLRYSTTSGVLPCWRS